ncbi:GNAT family N-acetyltransferase [Aurantimonas sp. HBX-1]|uniref:GNAT family N-acetyltransferase n=1 Tax=Aurantimonas sp. HBX-1 TaxID=2906072 RepID=UPI001F410F8B|nr:GNAT family N-acetyltransferase [Aurantimonas sp. HBX-1]UIJ73282.1 GNAT family N-acetyltransferase [Aurantimonas sp. HBX-1]
MTAPIAADPKPSALVLRDLALRDVDRVAEFEAAIARRSFADEAVTDLAHYRKKLGKLVKYGGDWTKVAERDGEIVGWAWVAPRQNFITGDNYADFRSFYVDGERAGSAASVMLLRAVLAHAKAAGYTRIVGRTATSNEAMRALYRLAGFEEKHVVYEMEIGGEGRDLG